MDARLTTQMLYPPMGFIIGRQCGGPGIKPGMCHTKDFKNSACCWLAWRSAIISKTNETRLEGKVYRNIMWQRWVLCLESFTRYFSGDSHATLLSLLTREFRAKTWCPMCVLRKINFQSCVIRLFCSYALTRTSCGAVKLTNVIDHNPSSSML